MPIMLHDLSILEWIWHDAAMHTCTISWDTDGMVTVCLRCEQNPEEDHQPLWDLGINTALVDVWFYEVWRWQMDGHDRTANRDEIDHWDIIQPSPLIAVFEQRDTLKVKLTHHRIRTMSGSTIDLVCEQIGLAEV